MQSKSLVSFDRHGMFTLEAPELLDAVSAAKLGGRVLTINHGCPGDGTIDTLCPGVVVNQHCEPGLNGLCGTNTVCG